MAEGDDKTESATPRRLEKAREEGQVAISRELSMLVSLSAGISAMGAQSNGSAIAHWLAASLQNPNYAGAQTWRNAGVTLIAAVAPVAAASAGTYAAATLLQSGFLLHPSGLQPDLTRISPLNGIKRLFGSQVAIQVLKAVAKLAVFAVCLWVAIRRLLPALPVLPFQDIPTLYRQLAGQGLALVLMLLGAQALIAGADLIWERMSLARKLRMTRQEQRDEQKMSEGNPQVKQRLRLLARSRARRRMLKAVPKAAVVITNPSHYAIALNYDRGSKGAPRLVAKGADEVAGRIRDLARAHNIPIIANPPLARALFRVEIDTEIPAEHFKAVAEIIAYVWRMRGRAGRR